VASLLILVAIFQPELRRRSERPPYKSDNGRSEIARYLKKTRGVPRGTFILAL